MDYLNLFGLLLSFLWMANIAVKSLMGKVSITSETWMERIYLFCLHAAVAFAFVKPIASVVHKILGGN